MTDTQNFGAACAPLIAAGFDPKWLLPAAPIGARLASGSTVDAANLPKVQGLYRRGSGAWSGRHSAYDDDKPALSFGRAPEKIEAEADWPTDSIHVVGHEAVLFDVDVADAEGAELAMQALTEILGADRVRAAPRRVRPNAPHRTSLVFAPAEPGSVPPSFTDFMRPGANVDDDGERLEWRGARTYWVCGGSMHPSGVRFEFQDSRGRPWAPGDGPPDWKRTDLPAVTAEETWAVLERMRELVEARGWTNVAGRGERTRAATGGAGRVVPSEIDPMVPIELLEEAIAAIPNSSEYEDALAELASLRFMYGREGNSIPEPVADWVQRRLTDSSDWLAEDKWGSFDAGVAPSPGAFMKIVQERADPELADRLQGAVDKARTLAAFAAIEEDDEDDDGDGVREAREPLLDHTPTEVEAAAFIMQATPLRGVLGYCEFRHQMVLRRPIPTPDGRLPREFTERSWTDTDDLDLLMWCQANGARKLKKGVCQDAAVAVAQRHPFHPVRDYLRGLRWDGVPRLSGWLAGYARATGDAAYLAAVGRATMIAAVARVMRPGCKVDTVLVLEGKQGIGKSSLFHAMVPDPHWFSDSMPHDLASKDARAHLRGKWFIELPELAQFRRTELAALKGFLTTGTDTYRPSYGRHEVTVERQCVFIASTNEDEYLADATGGRRYWPVALAGQVDLDGIRRDRDQLWAEAAEAFSRGEKWWITDPSIVPAVETVQASRQVGDGWDQIVADYVATKGVNAIVATDFLLDVLKLEPGAITQKSLQRVGDILRGMGWVKQAVRQEDGRQRKGWVRPHGLRVVAGGAVAEEGGRDPDLIETDDAARKRDRLKVVRPAARPGEA